MKNRVITPKIKKREGIIFMICFISAFTLNVIGIILVKSPAKELVTKLHVVLVLAVIFYMAILVLRLLYLLVSRLWTGIKK